MSLTIFQVNSAKTLGDQLALGHIKIFRAMVVGRVMYLSQSKSPKGIDITELSIKDDTGMFMVSIYRNEFPSDVLKNLLFMSNLKYFDANK